MTTSGTLPLDWSGRTTSSSILTVMEWIRTIPITSLLAGGGKIPRVLPDGRIEIRPRIRIDYRLYSELTRMARLLAISTDTVFARIVERWLEDKEADRLERMFARTNVLDTPDLDQ